MRERGECRKRVREDCDPTSVDSSIYVCHCCRENPASSFVGSKFSRSRRIFRSFFIDYSADEKEEERLASILNEIGADSLSATESPFSYLGFPIDVGNDGAVNCLDLNTLGIENNVSLLFAAEAELLTTFAAELLIVLSPTPKNEGQQRKCFSAYEEPRCS